MEHIRGNLNPYNILNNNLTQLQDYYKGKEKTLKNYNLAPEAFNRAIAKMQDEYDTAKFNITSVKSQLDNIKRGVARGQIDPMVGQQSMMQMVLPDETFRAMFPPQQQTSQRGRFTPNEFRSYVKEFSEAVGSAVVKPWLKRNYADPSQLKEQYFGARAKYGYDTDMNTTEKKAFDLAWDQAISGNKNTLKAWNGLVCNDPEIFMSRTYDARLLDIAVKKARGESISPMARSLQKQKKRTTGGFNFRLGGVAGPIGGVADIATEFATSRKGRKKLEQSLPRVSSDADYDRLQSGAQFLDPHGNIRTKP